MAPEINKKRILFVTTQSELGGAQQFLARLVNGLDRQRYACTVAAGDQGTNVLRTLLPADVHWRIVSHLKRNPHVIDDVRAVLDTRALILSERPDILFLVSSKAGFVGSAAALLTKRRMPALKVVYRIGGWTFNDPWPLWKKVFYTFLEKLSAHWKDAIVVNSERDLRDAQRLKIRPRRELLLIHNGIDPYLEFYDRERARLKLSERQTSLADTGPIVGIIANFYPSKDVTTFIRAAALFPDHTRACIIGDGPLRNEIQAEIGELGLEKRVFLLGTVPEAWRYLPAFDVFVLASRKEGFPWAVLEAMVAKVPVVATSVGAVPELIKNRVNGLIVQPGAPDQIAEAVKTLLVNESLRRETTMQAHQTIVKDFSLNGMVSAYNRLFLSL